MERKINHLRNTFLTLTLLVAVTAIFTRCTKSENNPYPAAANAITIQNDAFTPSIITVTVNTTIKWTNKDQVAHTVTSDTGLFDSGDINNNGTYSHQFTTVGTFPYHCSIHSMMTATVVVQ